MYGIIERICEVGQGSEANVIVELRTDFPGIGGTIVTTEGVVTALREEFSELPKAGHLTFLRHTVIKKIEDYFYRTKVYKYAHIPRPLGSMSREGGAPNEACLYEWSYGVEGFPWELTDSYGDTHYIRLRDWDAFVSSFHKAGINLALDVSDPYDGRISKNIIHQFAGNPTMNRYELSSIWKRIDFGMSSSHINFDTLLRFLHDNKDDLVDTLRIERYRMVQLSIEYLIKGKDGMKQSDIGKLDYLVGDYRHKTLIHYTSRGIGLHDRVTHVDESKESLL